MLYQIWCYMHHIANEMMLHASNPVILYYTQYDFMWNDIKLYHTLQAFCDKANESAGATHLVISYNMCTMWWWMRRAISVGFWHTMIQYYIISYYIYIIYCKHGINLLWHDTRVISIYEDITAYKYYINIRYHTMCMRACTRACVQRVWVGAISHKRDIAYYINTV